MAEKYAQFHWDENGNLVLGEYEMNIENNWNLKLQ